MTNFINEVLLDVGSLSTHAKLCSGHTDYCSSYLLIYVVKPAPASLDLGHESSLLLCIAPVMDSIPYGHYIS